ncbi:MAG TPA: wax ester/triacylglycerol synthase family O-acyltransferase [Mycobacteriales bacterium]|nr:wax ester/triacylglycerol synthase family O-acyltransferase [Mycobacteriales bacterium]
MSGLDASFLYFETPSQHMHVCGTLVLDPSTAPTPWTADTLRETVRERLPFIPPFRRRVHIPTLRLNHPSWVDTDVDVDDHVDVVQCPAPGDTAALCAVVGEFAGIQLDRSRPLWRMLLVEGLQDGRVGLVVKVHHCAVDGPAAANVLGVLFDLTPERRSPDELGRDLPPPAPQYSWARRVVRTSADLVRHPLTAARVVPSAAGAVRNIAQGRRGGPSAEAPVPFTGPRAPWNGAISPQRSVALVDVAVDDVKAVKDAVAGATFNDVVLALCGGALRSYLLAQDALPDAGLLAVCPVSVRTDAGAGNQQSAMFARLGTEIADPVERLHAVHTTTKAAKAEHEALGKTLILQAAELAPPTVTTLAARAYGATRLADLAPTPSNLVLSNLPGPPFRIYLGGAAVERVFPLGPVLDGFGLNVTVVSYNDRVGIGFIADGRRLPDLGDLAVQVPAAMAELVAAAGVRQAG